MYNKSMQPTAKRLSSLQRSSAAADLNSYTALEVWRYLALYSHSGQLFHDCSVRINLMSVDDPTQTFR